MEGRGHQHVCLFGAAGEALFLHRRPAMKLKVIVRPEDSIKPREDVR